MQNFKSFLNEVVKSGNSGINTSHQNQAVDNNVNMSVYSDPSVVKKLNAEEVFLPFLFEDSDGNAKGNDWAKGFVRGMQLHQEDWAKLSDDEENGGSLVPILALAHENDPDPKLRPYKEPVNEERREQLIMGLAAGAMNIYKYFEPHRRMPISTGNTFRRDTPKVGRNEPCPCGSGRKYKRCCGDVTLN